MPNRAAELRAEIETAHPGAVLRHRGECGLSYRVPGYRCRVAHRYITGPIHWQNEPADPWMEIDTDFEPHPGWNGHVKSAKYDTLVKEAGERRFYPRRLNTAEYVEFGVLEYFGAGNTWRTFSLGQSQHIENIYGWTGAGFDYMIGNGGVGTRTHLVLKADSLAKPVRWSMTLVGLTWDDGKFISNSDFTVVGILRPPTWTDAVDPRTPRPIPWEYADGYIVFTPDFTGAVYPVTVDPDYAITGSTYDGYLDEHGTDFNNSALHLYLGAGGSSTLHNCAFLHFDGVTAVSGQQVYSATVAFRTTSYGSGTGQTVEMRLWALDENTSPPPADRAAWDTDHTLHDTETATDWDFSNTTTNDQALVTPNIAAHVQHAFARVGWATGGVLAVHADCDGTTSDRVQSVASYDHTDYTAPTLSLLLDEELTLTKQTFAATIHGPVVTPAGYPTIAGSVAKSQTTTNSTTHTVTLPSGCVAGEWLVIIGSLDGNGSTLYTVTEPTGWDDVVNYPSWSNLCHGICAIKLSDGTEGGTTVDFTTSEAQTSRWMAFRVANCGGIWPVGSSSGNSTSPNTRIGYTGIGSKRVLWISWFAADGNSPATGWPTDYTYLQDSYAGAEGDGYTAVSLAAKQATAESDDPGAFTVGGAVGWVGSTLVCYPANVFVGYTEVSGDDGQRRAGVSFTTDNWSLPVGLDTQAIHGFFRFPGNSYHSPLPGAVINTAIQRCTYYANSSTTCNLRVKAEAADAAVAPTTGTQFDDLVLTTAYADWSPAAWTIVNLNDYADSPDLDTVVKEIVDRPGYARGNALMTVVKENGSSPTGYRFITPWDRDVNARRPYLVVDWEPVITLTLVTVTPSIKSGIVVAAEQPVTLTKVTVTATIHAPTVEVVATGATRHVNADVAATGWTTAPTPGQALYLQLDEEVADDDTTYIWWNYGGDD